MLKPDYCVIRNQETGRLLAGISFGTFPGLRPFRWASSFSRACHFENMEEARSTISFIDNVIDYELAEQLVVIHITPACML